SGACRAGPQDDLMDDPQAAPSWWATYFDDVFLRIYRPLMDEERTTTEVAAVRDLLGLAPAARLLDVGCGWGRHSIELASQGFQVTGVDYSPHLLQEAERTAAAEGIEVRWITGDMR